MMDLRPGHERVHRIVTVVLVLCACLVLLEIGRRALVTNPATTALQSRSPQFLENWERLAGGGNLTGREGAPVKIIEFADFQCAYCAEARGELDRIQGRYSESVAAVFRHYPLHLHAHSFAAAMAAECAAKQGRFVQYRDLLFASQDRIGTTRWSVFAEEAAVPDIPSFRRCMAEEATRGRVEEDLRLGQEIGVRTTPTIIVNGQAFFGADAMEAIEDLIRRTLAEQSQVVSFD